ncbi:hypothetical protein HYH03_016137 [Edaphochlamys debaryana]|uniref:Phosphatidic acid phosphatase type 2/haloperoxidase domain-containing protein n=1 Tax=Edaphochlamys debaryana TaxID=47281 RepID=A0A835XMX9_9CHLO|nr:hypothetical protein HYH03_016137 [Edaphochlamys debaryana]|eukprot:KAG2485151.1 hypothetical protein HYH03_016137 [Edaphochlamys debaryana]
MRLAAIVAALALAAATAQAAINSPVSEWLLIAQRTVVDNAIEHQQAARLYGLVGSVQYYAIKAVRNDRKLKGIPEGAAVAYASHSALSHLFYWRQTSTYDPALSRHLAAFGVSDAQVTALREALVPYVQKEVVKRVTDGGSLFANFKFAGNGTENWGKYQATPNQTTARYPQVAHAKGYYLSSARIDSISSAFRRFRLDDPEYAQQLADVKAAGALNSATRSPYDTDSISFWALGTGTGTIAGVWLNISISVIPEDTPLIHQARFFKLLGSSFWDAAIACWRVKYRELFWRPITAIRTPHGVGESDPTWVPFLSTPAHPEYPSGHQCSSGAAWALLETYLGEDFTFNATSYGNLAAGARTYPSFAAAAKESGDSRFYAGVHFQKANVDGAQLGYTIAREIHSKYFGGLTFKDAIKGNL